MDMKLGAGNVVLRLGDKVSNCMLKADAGASNLKVMVPEDTGMKIRIEGALAQNNLHQLGWTLVDGVYVSPNYSQAQTHIQAQIKMAVGNFTVQTVKKAAL
jgi:hypothetical protein